MKLHGCLFCLFLHLMFSTNTSAQYNFNKFLADAGKNIMDSNFTEAIQKLNICIQVEPTNKEVYFYRGICKYSLYDNIGAEQDYTTALSGYSPVFYDAYHNRALVRYRLGNYKGAIEDLNKVIEKEPNNPKLYIERGFNLLASSDFNAALNDCKKALKLKWLGADLFLCKASAEDALADYKNALCDYDAAININPGDIDLYVRRGMTKFKMESISDAIDDYNYAIKIDSACTFAYFNRAESEAKMGEYKKALADYNKVLAYEPRNAYAYFNRAVLFSNMHMVKSAIEDFDKVLILNPDNIQAFFNRAKLKQNINNFKGALNDYDRVIELYPYFLEAYYNRAQVKYNLRDSSGAKQDIETGKVMSEVFHSKNTVQLSRDSVLLSNLFRLNADFDNSSSVKTDTVIAGFLPLFYITEKDSNSQGDYSYIPQPHNLNNKNEIFYFSTRELMISFSPDENEITHQNDSTISGKVDEFLTVAIRKTNMLLLNEARKYYDKIIYLEPGNAIAWFARGVNTCREIEMEGNLIGPIINFNSSHTIVQNEMNEKCKSALADFSKALQLQPNLTFAYYNRAKVKCILQDYEGALKDYETAVKINPGFAEAFYNKGFLLYYLNNRGQACSDFSKAGGLGLDIAYNIMKRFCFK